MRERIKILRTQQQMNSISSITTTKSLVHAGITRSVTGSSLMKATGPKELTMVRATAETNFSRLARRANMTSFHLWAIYNVEYEFGERAVYSSLLYSTRYMYKTGLTLCCHYNVLMLPFQQIIQSSAVVVYLRLRFTCIT